MKTIQNLKTTIRQNKDKVILGIDIGTSGIRGCIVSHQNGMESILAEHRIALESPISGLNGQVTQDPQLWTDTLIIMLDELSAKQDLSIVTHVIADATSSTVLLTDHHGTPLTKALMYNDSQATSEAETIQNVINRIKQFSGATGASSTLAKALFLGKQVAFEDKANHPVVICHQLDYINHFFTGKLNITDENNALKLGFDSQEFNWPDWVKELLAQQVRLTPPDVIKPGSEIAQILPDIAVRFGFDSQVRIMAGTTDSIAGFLAAGANQIGDAVSSLGSTLAIKLISDKPVFDSRFGLYSHRLGKNWLVGGASNSGGKVVLEHFDLAALQELNQLMSSSQLNEISSGDHQYYPLVKQGERFPISDPMLQPVMPKKPVCKLIDIYKEQQCRSEHQYYLWFISLGLAQVEQLAYTQLSKLSGMPIKRIYTVGGGLQNRGWMQLRNKLLPAQIIQAKHQDAAYGVTKLIENSH